VRNKKDKMETNDVRKKKKKAFVLSLLCCDPNCLEWLRYPTKCYSNDKDRE